MNHRVYFAEAAISNKKRPITSRRVDRLTRSGIRITVPWVQCHPFRGTYEDIKALIPFPFSNHYKRRHIYGVWPGKIRLNKQYDFESQGCRFESCRVQIKFQSLSADDSVAQKLAKKIRCSAIYPPLWILCDGLGKPPLGIFLDRQRAISAG
jgi:hypothetical protein